MTRIPLDAQERLALCDLFGELGPDAPALLKGWTARDLAAHLVLRERDVLAGPCLVLPGPFQRFAEGRGAILATQSFDLFIGQMRSGPPRGFFRLPWVRALPNLNEFFVHHEDLRRANRLGPRNGLSPDLQLALWRNVRLSSRSLSRSVPSAAASGMPVISRFRGHQPFVRSAAYECAQPGRLLLVADHRYRGRDHLHLGCAAAVAPVTYVAAGPKVVIHVEADKELLSSIDGHVVALQVDHVDKDTLDGWQVTVTGIAKLGLLDGQRRTLSLTSAITAGRRVKLA